MKALNILMTGAMILAGTTSALAQDDESSTHQQPVYHGFGMRLGTNYFNLDNLNDRLNTSGIEQLNDKSSFLGGTCYSIKPNRVVTSGEGGFFGQRVHGSTQSLDMSGGYFLFNLGYAVMNSRRVKIFPMVGIGLGGIDLEITETGLNPSFDEILDQPTPRSTVSTGVGLLNLGVGIDHVFTGSDPNHEGGFMVGLRAGYLFSSNDEVWTLADQEITGGPGVGIAGPYMHLIIGGAGLETK